MPSNVDEAVKQDQTSEVAEWIEAFDDVVPERSRRRSATRFPSTTRFPTPATASWSGGWRR